MSNAWDDRKKALEEEYFRKQDQDAIEKLKKERLLGHCPKCGVELNTAVFHDLSLDQCPTCHGFWLTRDDLENLAKNDHRSWFSRYLK